MNEDYTVEDRRPFDTDGNLKEGATEDSGSGGNPQEVKTETPEQPKPPTIIEKILMGDVIGKFIAAGLIPQKYIVNKNQLISNKKLAVPAHETPWCFVHNSADRDCGWNMDKGAVYRFIPRKCRNCWKVVVYPNTLKELLMLKKLMEEMVKEDPYCLCKCGIEPRESVERNYGGYFYNNSLEHGVLRLEQVKRLVHEKINPDIRVLLKRGCTEFEREFGDSAMWDEMFDTPFWNSTEDVLDTIAKIDPQDDVQGTLVQNHVLANWVKFAAERGDPTVKELNNGNTIYPDYRTYSRENLVYEEDENAEGNE